jgi:hypothetical protein
MLASRSYHSTGRHSNPIAASECRPSASVQKLAEHVHAAAVPHASAPRAHGIAPARRNIPLRGPCWRPAAPTRARERRVLRLRLLCASRPHLEKMAIGREDGDGAVVARRHFAQPLSRLGRTAPPTVYCLYPAPSHPPPSQFPPSRCPCVLFGLAQKM